MGVAEQKRIGELVPLADNEIDNIINSGTDADNWAMAVDYVVPDSDEAPQADQGTKYIPVSRIGLLTRTRLVPQSMLPSIVASGAVYDGRIANEGNKYTFTVTKGPDTGKKYVCPKPTEPGEELPDIDTIYRDVLDTNGRTIYTQYRYIPTAHSGTVEEEGEFVPIPSDLVMVDGKGTVVTDDRAGYSRQIDINIGSPTLDPAVDSNVLFVDASTKQLKHSTTAVTAGSYPSSQEISPVFGGTLDVPKLTVNSTGHATAIGTDSITIPNTPARYGVAGLVMVGNDNDVQPIGSDNRIGTVPASGYVKVAAADHVHTAATFTMTNTNDGTKVYNGSVQVEYDFRKFLQAKLPSSAPSNAGTKVLATTSAALDNDGYRSTAWVDIDTIVVPRYAFIPLHVSNAVSTGGTVLSLGSSLLKSSVLSYVQPSSGNPTTIQGLLAGKLYIVTFALVLERNSAGQYLDTFTFTVWNSNSSSENGYVRTIIDETIAGNGNMPNYVHGSLFFIAEAGQTQCQFKAAADNANWTINGSGSLIQICEVK